MRQSGAPVNPFAREKASSSPRSPSEAPRTAFDSRPDAQLLSALPHGGRNRPGFGQLAFHRARVCGTIRPAREPPLPFQEPAEFYCGLPVESRICSAGGNKNRVK